jgi:hypothetical protein
MRSETDKADNYSARQEKTRRKDCARKKKEIFKLNKK